jgi:SAM-dependent methyltransferase/uncharacterized protein YbaR (Trm112 family)
VRRRHFDLLRPVCPVCAAHGREARPLVVAERRDGSAEELRTGVLHCADPACWREFPIVDGIPMIVPDLRQLLVDYGAQLLLRDDVDPVLESLIGDALGPGSWFDAARQVQSTYGWDAYADLDPEEAPARQGPVPGAARRCLERLESLVPDDEPRVILDLGCAAGRTSFALAERHPGAIVIGIDRDLGTLRLAAGAARGAVSYPRRRIGLVFDRRRFPVSFAVDGRVDFWACDALALPFSPGSVDRIVALNLLDCVPDPRRLLAGLAALLRPGGVLLLATPFDWSTRATPVEAWIGGHSQRGAQGGRGENFLRQFLSEPLPPRTRPELEILGEVAEWPWHTRLHDRSAVQYLTQLLALRKVDG